MPFNKRTVEPINLSQVQLPKNIPNELECVANQTLANIIRQLSSLGAHAQDLFDELITDAGHIVQRTEALHGRIERLKLKVTQLDSNKEEVSIQDVNNQKPFVSVTRIDQQVVNRATMPQSLRLLYDQAEPAPALHLLNPYRDDGRDSMKFYTDPSFFFNLWMQSMITRQAPPPPTLLSQSEPDYSMTQYPPIIQTIAIPSAIPPPPPPAPPLPINMDLPTLATTSEIDNFPPPPADFIEHSSPQMPLNIPSISSSQCNDVSITSETSVQDQRPYVMRDIQSDLLDQIKKGIQLNNRKKEEEKKAGVTTKPSPPTVMEIMEQALKDRRDKVRPQREPENEDDESSRCDEMTK